MKKITILLIMAIVCQVCANAQNPKAFTAVIGTKDIGASEILFPTKDKLYLVADRFRSLGKDYKITYYNNIPEFDATDQGIVNIKTRKDNIVWASNYNGIIVLELPTDTTELKVLHKYSSDNIKNFTAVWQINQWSNLISKFCFDKTGEYVYYMPYVTDNTTVSKDYCLNEGKSAILAAPLLRITAEKADTSECMVANMLGDIGIVPSDATFMDKEGYIWATSYVSYIPAINKYNPLTNDFIAYNKDNLPLSHPPNSDSTRYTEWNIRDMMELPDKYNNSILALAHICEDKKKQVVLPWGDTTYKYTTISAFNKILIYDNGKWDTIAVPSILKDYGLPTGNFEKMKMWGDSDDEILFSVQNGGNVVLLIYNLAAKTWRHFKLPYVGLEEYGIKFYDYAFWNSKHYFLLNRYDPMDGKEYHFGALLEYDPAKDPTGIEDETEAGIIPDLWIRKLTPNPATSSVNVNIMYYPTGIYSNDLKVGLYNYMGEKIIDLTPLGTYTEHNHTWEATFDIPKRLAGGMYFLNVRSGDESRTKGIAIY